MLTLQRKMLIGRENSSEIIVVAAGNYRDSFSCKKFCCCPERQAFAKENDTEKFSASTVSQWQGLLIIFSNSSGIVRASRDGFPRVLSSRFEIFAPSSPEESKLGEWSRIQLTPFKHSRPRRFLRTS